MAAGRLLGFLWGDDDTLGTRPFYQGAIDGHGLRLVADVEGQDLLPTMAHYDV